MCFSAVLLCALFYTIKSFPVDEDLIDLSHLGAKVFGKPSNETGQLVKEWNADLEVNPEEIGDYAEGDILFPNYGRNGLVATTYRWSHGSVPYEISGYFTSNEKNMINEAMNNYHKYTCVRFRPRNGNDQSWISITSSNTGCWSSVGRTGGRQVVNLQSPGCFHKIGTPIHELMHVVGFMHEQNRWERDSYVDIKWTNIKKGKEGNFRKADKGTTTGFGINYDFSSVMHYSAKAFSSNEQPTIVAKIKDTKMGQRDGFSPQDIKKINLMYDCENSNVDNNNNNVNQGNPGIVEGLLTMIFP